MGITTLTADTEQIMLEHTRGILAALPSGVLETIDAAHWKDTPKRMAEHFQSMFWGCLHDAGAVLKQFEEPNGALDQIVLVRGIEYVSWCSHHFLPFMGTVDFAYMPCGSMVGLSKIPRMVSILAARPQVQEKFTQEIADTFKENVNAVGIAVRVQGRHTCMMARGVLQRDAEMVTSVMYGAFRDKPEARQEFFEMVKR